VAVLKTRLYEYGGRPAIYVDSALRNALAAERQASGRDERYLLAPHYFPGKSDWMHEREWRVVPNMDLNQKIGLSAEYTLTYAMGNESNHVRSDRLVPIHLPVISQDIALPHEPEFVLMVETEEDARRLAKSLREGNCDSSTGHGCSTFYGKRYREVLARAMVISFERVKDGRDREGLWRLEDFLNPSRPPSGVGALWDRASMKGRRKALRIAALSEESGVCCFYPWCDLQGGDWLLFPGSRNAIEQSQDAIQALRDDVRLWVQTFFPDSAPTGDQN
jgi:hypothetical protein